MLPMVTDHAVLRYLERAKGINIRGLRREIADQVINGINAGADRVVINGVKFVLRADRVITVIGKGGV
jgi:hypothetical protein